MNIVVLLIFTGITASVVLGFAMVVAYTLLTLQKKDVKKSEINLHM